MDADDLAYPHHPAEQMACLNVYPPSDLADVRYWCSSQGASRAVSVVALSYTPGFVRDHSAALGYSSNLTRTKRVVQLAPVPRQRCAM